MAATGVGGGRGRESAVGWHGGRETSEGGRRENVSLSKSQPQSLSPFSCFFVSGRAASLHQLFNYLGTCKLFQQF